MKKSKIGQHEICQTASLILDTVWERACEKYEAFVEIDEEWRLGSNKMTDGLNEVITCFLRCRSYANTSGNLRVTLGRKIYNQAEIKQILLAIEQYNLKCAEVILVTDKEKRDLRKLGFGT